MNFLYPQFLYALFAVAIPIVIHLFSFRKYKKVYFSNVDFIEEIKKEKQSRSNLRQLLILLLRILAITALVLAFAQPFIPNKNAGRFQQNDRVICIYLDNSFSMSNQNEGGVLFAQAKNHTRELISSFRATDRFMILTNDFEGRHQRIYSKEEVSELLEEVEISSKTKSVSQVVSRFKEVVSEEENKLVFLFSDFQKNQADISEMEVDSSYYISSHPITPSEVVNLLIDSCWFETPYRQAGQTEKLHIRVRNNSNQNLSNIPIKLSVNGAQRALGSFGAEPESYVDTVVYFTSENSGFANGKISIEDSPVTYDDEFYFGFKISDAIPVLCINGKDSSNAIFSVFKSDPQIKLKQVFEKNFDISLIESSKFIILNECQLLTGGVAMELQKFSENGGAILFIPSMENIEKQNEFLSKVGQTEFERVDTTKQKVKELNLKSALYNDVFESVPENIDLPMIRKHLVPKNILLQTQEILLRLQNGNPILSSNTFNKAILFRLNISLNNSENNFTKHSLFVPTLHKMALLSTSSSVSFYTIGINSGIEVSGKITKTESPMELRNYETKTSFIPESRMLNGKTYLSIANTITESGNYLVANGSETIDAFGLNYNRKESAFEYLTPKEITSEMQSAEITNTSVIQSNEDFTSLAVNENIEGIKLWKYCLILLLLFLAFEILVIKLWK